MNASNSDDNNDIPAEVDFTGGTRGKFYRPSARLNLPVYLDADVQAYLAALAAKELALAGAEVTRISLQDYALPLFDASPLDSAIDASFDRRRAVMLLLGSFAALALSLTGEIVGRYLFYASVVPKNIAAPYLAATQEQAA